MFGILLRVVTQVLRILLVLFAVASTSCCSCYRVYVSPVALNATVCFRRGAEDTEPSEVEIEKIRRGIDAPQRSVEIEVVALITLYETSRENYLEDVATKTMTYALTDIPLVFFVGQRRCHLADSVKAVSPCCGFVYGTFYVVQHALVANGHKRHLAVVVVKDYYVTIEHIQHVGSIVLVHRRVFDVDILEISHSIKRGVSIESYVVGVFALYLKVPEEVCQRPVCGVVAVYHRLRRAAVGQGHSTQSVTYCYACHRTYSYERTRVVGVVIVATLHKGTLRIEVAQTHVCSYRRIYIGKNCSGMCDVLHTILLFR